MKIEASEAKNRAAAAISSGSPSRFIKSYCNVNLYNPHYDRHVIGPLRIVGEKGNVWTFDASYSLFQTDLEGNTRIFSVGRYRVEALVEGEAARLKSVTVIADTGTVSSLLATPI